MGLILRAASRSVTLTNMTSAYQAYANNAPIMSLTALSRWSVASKQLPAMDKIKAIHVYDFDNTLFNSPLPNAKIWNGQTLGYLQTEDTFATGGWWHDSRILAATGEGVEIEEPRGWNGWWNEEVAKLVELSMQQSDTLTVLLTGRRDDRYDDLIKRMLASKKLDFDMVVLKPNPGPNGERFTSTMNFKQAYLTTLMETYKTAGEIRVYEDRVKHTKAFREFFTEYNRRQNGLGGSPTRSPIVAEVIQVADGLTTLDPVAEAAVVLQIVNDHNKALKGGHRGKNWAVKKTVFYTGYLITHTDTQKLLTLPHMPANIHDGDMKILANNVLITPRPAPASILEKVGGMGSKLIWEVTGTGVFENKVWAASLRPVPSTAKYYTENPTPIVVLAVRKGARPFDAGKIQNWQPVPAEKQFRFETTVGEKVLLRVEEEDLKQDEYESLFPTKGKRKQSGDNDLNVDSGSRNGNNQYDNYNYQQTGRGNYQQQYSGGGRSNENRNPRGGWHGKGNNNNNGSGRGRGGGGRGGNGGNGRGRRGGGGGGYNYRSLDDLGGAANGGGGGQGYGERAQVGYGDYSPRGQYGGTNQQQGQQAPGTGTGTNNGGGYQQAQQQQNGYGNNYQQYGAGGPPY